MTDAEKIETLEKKLADLQKLVASSQVLGSPPSTTRASASPRVFPPVEPFSYREKDWEAWIAHYSRYRRALHIVQEPESVQVNDLLLHMGPQVKKLFQQMQVKEDDFKTYTELVDAFTKHFTKPSNVIYERAKFNLRNQREGETCSEYISALIEMAKECKYGALENELIRDRLIVGISDHKLSETLQLDDSLTLEKTIAKVKQAETVKSQNLELRAKIETSKVERIQKTFASNKAGTRANVHTQRQNVQCSRCGTKPNHPRRYCPASKARCRRCDQVGHFQKFCKTKKVNEVEEETSGSEPEGEINCSEIQLIGRVRTVPAWTVTLSVEGVDTQFKVDTGADVTILSRESFDMVKKPVNVKTTKVHLQGPSGRRLQIYGKLKVNVNYKGKQQPLKMFIADTKENLLGRKELELLKIIKWEDKHLQLNIGTLNHITTPRETGGATSYSEIKKQFGDLFAGLGRIKNFEYNIKIKPNAEPYVTTVPRRVPIPLLEQVREELNKMVREGVIEKIEEPTDWCSPMVVIKKPSGGVRICSDYTQLNKFVQRERYLLPTVEETLAKIQEGKIFSKLDCSSGFHQLALSSESKKLTTFITPFGRFAYNRCPFGISSAPEVFQKTLNYIIERSGTSSVIVHADDIVVSGKDKMEHNRNLVRVLQTLRENGVTLNAKKCEIGVARIEYLGYVISDRGVEPNQDYVRAIREYREPTNVTEVRQFLGMVTYLTKFIDHFSDQTKPLRDLLKKEVEFTWGAAQQTCLHRLKKAITEVPILAVYNVNYPTRISADASSIGIGGLLEQQHPDGSWRTVAYSSKSLTETQRRYSQIEKECYAIYTTVNRFRQFLLGKKFTIRTDHKPLVTILTSKPINDLSLRLQNFRMKLTEYDYKVIHIPGKELSAPDALSRKPLEITEEGDEIVPYKTIAAVEIVNHTETEIEKMQSTDEALQVIKNYVVTGWPDIKQCEQVALPYFKYRAEIGVTDEILTYKDRIIVPSEQRRECMREIHEGHLGINKCKARARQSVWWPSINKHIEDSIKACEMCIKNSSPQIEPLLPLQTPILPWSIVGVDLCELRGKKYLVMQDYYSKYIEVVELKRTESRSIIHELKQIFGGFGIPSIVRSDNGPQFDSWEFREFAGSYKFKWISSSPTYPQANGLAESAVKTAKRIFKKSEDPQLGLLAYRNTPLACGASPSQLLMGRQLRERLPTRSTLLIPQTINHSEIRQKMLSEKRQQKHYFDHRHRAVERTTLPEDSRVWVTNKNEEGKILKTVGHRSYLIETEKGERIRRNRVHLKKLNSPEREKGKQQPVEKTLRPKRVTRKPAHFQDFVV